MARAPLVSAGLLLYRRIGARLEVLVAHPGGPFFARRDAGWWSVPKGLVDGGEDPLDAARREFAEETGHAPSGPFLPLGSVVQKSGKRVLAWACAGDLDPRALVSNTFVLEWPRGSGRAVAFPEIDEVRFVELAEARRLLVPAQVAFLERLADAIG